MLVNNSLKKYPDCEMQKTDFGTPLLLVCIDNEEPSHNFINDYLERHTIFEPKWQLRELMIRLLTDYKCDLNIQLDNPTNLIGRALWHFKFQSFKLIIDFGKD